jgi:glycosyltransferase involved in cell wall biosynthesis
VLDQPPFGNGYVSGVGEDDGDVAVIVPTRNRPDRLSRCLEALAAAQRVSPCPVYVCDSSRAELAPAVKELCDSYPFAHLVRHDRSGASAARNVGTAACRSKLVVSVDDDVYVTPGAIEALVQEYREQGGGAVIAGSVEWSHWRSRPLVMRRIGFGREAEPGEDVEFLVSALILYPRELGLEFPWNERLWPYDDRYVSLMWKTAGAKLGFTPEGSARHDEVHTDYPVPHEADRIYVNLLDSVLVSRSPGRFLGFEFLSFAACAKKWARSPRGAWGIVRAWARGHLAFLRDLPKLRAMVSAAKSRQSRPR